MTVDIPLGSIRGHSARTLLQVLVATANPAESHFRRTDWGGWWGAGTLSGAPCRFRPLQADPEVSRSGRGV